MLYLLNVPNHVMQVNAALIEQKEIITPLRFYTLLIVQCISTCVRSTTQYGSYSYLLIHLLHGCVTDYTSLVYLCCAGECGSDRAEGDHRPLHAARAAERRQERDRQAAAVSRQRKHTPAYYF
jgi:hypothetical protein